MPEVQNDTEGTASFLQHKETSKDPGTGWPGALPVSPHRGVPLLSHPVDAREASKTYEGC